MNTRPASAADMLRPARGQIDCCTCCPCQESVLFSLTAFCLRRGEGWGHLLGMRGGDVGNALEAVVDVVVGELLELRVPVAARALLPPLAPRRDVVAEEQRQQIRQVAVRPQHRLLGAPTHACHAPIHVPYLQALLSFLCLKRNRIHQPLPGKRMQASKDQPAVLSQDDLGGA